MKKLLIVILLVFLASCSTGIEETSDVSENVTASSGVAVDSESVTERPVSEKPSTTSDTSWDGLVRDDLVVRRGLGDSVARGGSVTEQAAVRDSLDSSSLGQASVPGEGFTLTLVNYEEFCFGG